MRGIAKADEVELLVRGVFAFIEAKDLGGVMALFAEDAVLIDPHFPEPRMVGRSTIAHALGEAFKGMEAFGYTIDRYFEMGGGSSAAVEVSTHHVIRRSMTLSFPQVFVFDVADGLVRRMQAYEPYGPHGLVGAILVIERTTRRLMHWLKLR